MAVKQTHRPVTLLQQQYQQFWQVFNRISSSNEDFCREFTPHQYASIRSYQDFSIGRKYHISTGVDFSKGVIRVKAYFRNPLDYLDVYEKRKNHIEDQMGKTLIWQSFTTKGAISLYAYVGFDVNNYWEEACKVMMENMIKMKNVIK